MARWKAGCLIAVMAAMVSLTVIQIRRTLKDPRCDTSYLFTADILQPASIYQDLFIDGYSLHSYQLSGANFVFPDQLLYFVLRAMIGNTSDAIAVWTMLIFPMVLLGAVLAARSIVPTAQRMFAAPLILATGCILLLHSSQDFFTDPAVREAFLPVFHNGAVFAVMIGLAMITRASFTDASRKLHAGLLVLLTAVCFATVASDRLFLSWFIAPAIVALPITRTITGTRTSWIQVIMLVLAIALGGALGLIGAKALHGRADAIQNYWTEGLIQGLPKRAGLLGKAFLASCRDGNLLAISASLWFVVSNVILFNVLRNRFSRLQHDSNKASPSLNNAFIFYCVFSVTMTISNAIVFLLSKSSMDTLGNHSWNQIARYFNGPAIVALFGWPILFTHRLLPATLVRWQWITVPVPIIIATMILITSLLEPRQPTRPVIDDYPETVRRIDDACDRLGLTDGLGDYDTAKRITMLSRRGVRVRQIAFDRHLPCGFAAFHWISNAAWYWQPPVSNLTPINYEFILVHPQPIGPHEPSPEELEQLFGPAVERIDIGSHLMLVYNRPHDKLRSIISHHDCLALNLRFRFGDEQTTRYPGGSFHSPKRLTTIESDRTANEGRDQPGLIAYGPYLTPPIAGRYRITFNTSSAGTVESNGSVDVILNRAGKDGMILATRDIPPTIHHLTTIELEVSPAMLKDKLEFRTFYSGRGTLTLHWVEIEKIP